MSIFHHNLYNHLEHLTLEHRAFTKIAAAETQFNDLLPAERLKGHPSTALLNAARVWSETVWAAAEQMESLILSTEQIKQGLQLAQSPVFICGAHRSGTTLLRDILDGHPDLVVLPSEGTFYTRLETKLKSMPEKEWPAYLGSEWLRRLANPINQPPYWLLGRSTIAGSPYIKFAQWLKAWWTIVDRRMDGQWPHTAVVLAYASCLNNLSAKYWIDKTPGNERFLVRIRKEMPSAKIIHLLREPIATIASHKKMDPSWNFRHALYDLKNSFEIASTQSAQGDPGFLLVRYEDICREPKKIIAKLASFLNIELSQNMNRPTVAGIPSGANSSFDKQAPAGLILSSNNSGHDKLLSEAEKKRISVYLGKLSAQHHYPLLKVGLFTKLYLAIKYRVFG